jgi:nitrile hydratase subunit beta
MDGIHDLGGRIGFGPIDVNEPEEQFHHAWEARTLAVIRAMARPIPWSIDWFRQVRERIEPVDYLTRPYYDQWLQTYAAMLVHAGAATVEEIATGESKMTVPGLVPPMGQQDVATAKTRFPKFNREIDESPRFAVGDKVRVQLAGFVGHTRLPQYARGRFGQIEAYRGGYIFPDSNATDDGFATPLYTVAFAASELWPEAKGSRDRRALSLMTQRVACQPVR